MELPSSLAAHDGAVSDKNTRGQWGDALFGMVARLAGWSLLAVMAGIILVLVWGGRQAFLAFGPAFLTSTAWNPISHHFGAATSIFGTLVTTAVALVFAVPFAFGVAFWLVEMAPPALARFIETAVQLLAAVPSIIFGMWGFFIVVPFMAHHVEPAATHYLGHVPGIGLLFRGAPYGTGLLTGGIILAIMVTPFICSVMTDVFVSIPAVLKESAFGLGATRWEVMRQVVLPWSWAASCWAPAAHWGKPWPSPSSSATATGWGGCCLRRATPLPRSSPWNFPKVRQAVSSCRPCWHWARS